jgi:poly-beta-1,6-N-acetyl-D-glucosamine synthase
MKECVNFAKIMGLFYLILLLAIFAYSALMLLCIRAFSSIDAIKVPKHYHGKTPISVIIPARNEEANIEACIKSINNQYYEGDVEIIVINDHSSDGTAAILEKYKATITIIDGAKIPKQAHDLTNAYKKNAISYAVQVAQGDIIVTTDADTIRGPRWLATIAYFLEKKSVKLVAGPVTYAKTKSPIGIFETIDFLMMQGIAAAGLEFNFYHSCNGANLGYQKSTFNAVHGYHGTADLASGDDIFLLRKVIQKYHNSAKYILNEDAIVTTFSMNALGAFFQQRIRWAGKATAYKDLKSSTLLSVTAIVNLGLLALLVLSFLGITKWITFFLFFAAKVIPEAILLQKVLRFFKRLPLLFSFVILQPLHWLYIVIIGLVAPFASFKWKGRKAV